VNGSEGFRGVLGSVKGGSSLGIEGFNSSSAEATKRFFPPKLSSESRHFRNEQVAVPAAANSPEFLRNDPAYRAPSRCGLKIGKPFFDVFQGRVT
jgi:hypothetical protein